MRVNHMISNMRVSSEQAAVVCIHHSLIVVARIDAVSVKTSPSVLYWFGVTSRPDYCNSYLAGLLRSSAKCGRPVAFCAAMNYKETTWRDAKYNRSTASLRGIPFSSTRQVSVPAHLPHSHTGHAPDACLITNSAQVRQVLLLRRFPLGLM